MAKLSDKQIAEFALLREFEKYSTPLSVRSSHSGGLDEIGPLLVMTVDYRTRFFCNDKDFTAEASKSMSLGLRNNDTDRGVHIKNGSWSPVPAQIEILLKKMADCAQSNGDNPLSAKIQLLSIAWSSSRCFQLSTANVTHLLSASVQSGIAFQHLQIGRLPFWNCILSSSPPNQLRILDEYPQSRAELPKNALAQACSHFPSLTDSEHVQLVLRLLELGSDPYALFDGKSAFNHLEERPSSDLLNILRSLSDAKDLSQAKVTARPSMSAVKKHL